MKLNSCKVSKSFKKGKKVFEKVDDLPLLKKVPNPISCGQWAEQRLSL